MTIKKIIFLIIIPIFIFFNCSDEPTSFGDIPRGKITLEIFSSDSLNQVSSFFHPQNVTLSAAERILLGKTDNINASILIRFSVGLADSIKEDIRNNEVTVTSAVMELQQVYTFGDSLSAFDFNVHKVLSNWSIDFNEDSILQFDPELQVTKDINDSVTTVNLPNQLLLDWLHIIADTSLTGNYGIYLQPTDNTQKVLGYQALTSTFIDIPIIKVVIEKTGAYTDTITFNSTSDLTVMKGVLPAVSPGNIAIRAGYLVQGKLFFDLTPVPKDIAINKAELTLTLDSLETKVGSSFVNSIQAYFLFDSTNTDSISSSSVTLVRNGNTFSGKIEFYVDQWLKNNNNSGIILSPGGPINGVELFVINGSQAVVNKPLLKITYTKLNK